MNYIQRSKDIESSQILEANQTQSNNQISQNLQKKIIIPFKKPSYSLKPFFFGGNEETIQSIKEDHAAQDKKIIYKIKPGNLNKNFACLKDENFKTIFNQNFMKFVKREQVQLGLPKRKSKSEYISIKEMQNKDYEVKEQKPQNSLKIEEIEKKLEELTQIADVTNKYLKKQKKQYQKQNEEKNVYLKQSSANSLNIDTSAYWQNKFNKNTQVHNKILSMITKQNEIQTPSSSMSLHNQSANNLNLYTHEKIFRKMKQIKELSKELKIGEIHALKLLYKSVFDQINAFQLYDESLILIKLNEYQSHIDQEIDIIQKDIYLYSALKFVTHLSELEPSDDIAKQEFRQFFHYQQFHLTYLQKHRNNISCNSPQNRNISTSQSQRRIRGLSQQLKYVSQQQISPSNSQNILYQKQNSSQFSQHQLNKPSFSFHQENSSQKLQNQHQKVNNKQRKSHLFLDLLDLKNEMATPALQSTPNNKVNNNSIVATPNNLKYHIVSNFIIKGKDLNQLSHSNKISKNFNVQPQSFTNYFDNFLQKHVVSAKNNQDNYRASNSVDYPQSSFSNQQNNIKQNEKNFSQIQEDAIQCIEQQIFLFQITYFNHLSINNNRVWNDKFGTPSSRNEVLNLAYNTASNQNLKTKLRALNNKSSSNSTNFNTYLKLPHRRYSQDKSIPFKPNLNQNLVK